MIRFSVAIVLGSLLIGERTIVRFARQLIDASLCFGVGSKIDDSLRHLGSEAFGERVEDPVQYVARWRMAHIPHHITIRQDERKGDLPESAAFTGVDRQEAARRPVAGVLVPAPRAVVTLVLDQDVTDLRVRVLI